MTPFQWVGAWWFLWMFLYGSVCALMSAAEHAAYWKGYHARQPVGDADTE